jgi:transposase
MANKHYPQQFKADAVALYRSRPGASLASIADDLGVNRETLRSWVRVDDQRRGAAAAVATGSVEDENAQLRRRVRDLEGPDRYASLRAGPCRLVFDLGPCWSGQTPAAGIVPASDKLRISTGVEIISDGPTGLSAV